MKEGTKERGKKENKNIEKERGSGGSGRSAGKWNRGEVDEE